MKVFRCDVLVQDLHYRWVKRNCAVEYLVCNFLKFQTNIICIGFNPPPVKVIGRVLFPVRRELLNDSTRKFSPRLSKFTCQSGLVFLNNSIKSCDRVVKWLPVTTKYYTPKIFYLKRIRILNSPSFFLEPSVVNLQRFFRVRSFFSTVLIWGLRGDSFAVLIPAVFRFGFDGCGMRRQQ